MRAVLSWWALVFAVLFAAGGAAAGGSSEIERLERYRAMDGLLAQAYARGDQEAVRRLAHEYLDSARGPLSWIDGDAIHEANRYLGLVSLASGDVQAAAGYLRAAGRTRGSSRLDYEGPELDLAHALLQRGEVAAVCDYLRDVAKFWVHGPELHWWVARIEQGERPRLDRSMVWRTPRAVLVIAATAWPALVTFAAVARRRRNIRRKVRFVLTALPAAYISFMAAAWVAGHPTVVSVVKHLPGSLAHYAHACLEAAAFVFPMVIVSLLARLAAADSRRCSAAPPPS